MNTGQSHTPPTAAERISAELLRSHVRTAERLRALRSPDASQPMTPPLDLDALEGALPGAVSEIPSLIDDQEIEELAFAVLKLLHGLRVCDVQADCEAASGIAGTYTVFSVNHPVFQTGLKEHQAFFLESHANPSAAPA